MPTLDPPSDGVKTPHLSDEIDLTALKTLIRDLGDMACIGCRAKTCPPCSLAAEITNEVHLLAHHVLSLPPAQERPGGAG